MSSMPSASQPWRPKHKSGGGGGGGMGGQSGSTGSGGGGGRNNSFETDGQISHRTHKYNHNPHGFQKYQDPSGAGGAAAAGIPMPASQQQQLAAQQAAVAQQVAQQQHQFNREDALDAFGNIREAQWFQNAVEWAPVQDSGVSHRQVHSHPSKFIMMCAEATKPQTQ